MSSRAPLTAVDRPPGGRRTRRSARRSFRLDIEGLRGVAVLLVVLFHAKAPGFDGGYIGVDVFFVISGFLITGLLLDELSSSGRVSFSAFYARRARRLLPSAGLVIVVSAVAAALTLTPLVARAVVDDGLVSSIFGANFRFAGRAADYFEVQRSPSPFLHFWSLSLEEQFYAVWPALLAVVAARPRFNRRHLAFVMVAIFVVSLGASVWLTDHDRPWAFFMLPTRAWEFAVGGAIAAWGSRAVGGTQAITWFGLALVGVAAVVFDSGSPFPGWIALVPVLGTAAVIVNSAGPGTAAGRVLGSGPLPWLGRRSYVLYLWHWPMLVLVPVALGQQFSLAERLGVCTLAVLLADLTHRVIERPVHTSRWMVEPPRRGISVGAAIVTGTVAVSGLTLLALPTLSGSQRATREVRPQSVLDVQRALSDAIGTTDVPANLIPPLSEVGPDVPRLYADGCFAAFEGTELPPARCVYGEPDSETAVVVLGDSHAGQWFPALEAIAERQHVALVPLIKASCPVPELSVTRFDGTSYPECDEFRERALDRIRQLEPAVVILANSRSYREAAEAGDAWREAWARSTAMVTNHATTVIVLEDTPFHPYDVPVCLSAHLDDVEACETARDTVVNARGASAERDAALAAGATFVETMNWICTPRACPPIVGRLLVWRDSNHLSTVYVRWLTDVIAEALAIPGG